MSRREHLENVAANLQLIADLGYGDTALATADERGRLTVIVDARPSTAPAPFKTSRAGAGIAPREEPEAYEALAAGRPAEAVRRRVIGGVTYAVSAYPVGVPDAFAVVLRTYAEQLEAAPSRMERAFVDSARDLLGALRGGPILDVHGGRPFATSRTAGDGLMRVDLRGRVTYASPNAVGIMRLAGVEGRVTGSRAAELPGAGLGISPVLGTGGAIWAGVEVADRVLSYRSIALATGALVLVEDLTEARRRERELELKETTIREVHHRVKNNLQTIASLLRLQARRSDNDEVRRALSEATERAASMAAVHDLLSRSDDESVDFAHAARTVVELVRRSLLGADDGVAVDVLGDAGQIDANTATALALVLVELVHNALEHGFAPGDHGAVAVRLDRDGGELTIVVEDDGRGLPPDFDLTSGSSLGFSIMRSLIDDLRGTLSATSGPGAGTTVTVRVPLPYKAARA